MDIINKPLGWVLELCSKIVGGNYLFAILIFAVIVELVLLPFGIIQQKKSIKQARLRPKEMAIRKKYSGRDDKPTQMKMNEEIQELYQKEGYNPLGGCLPLLIQFPLLIALYNVVINPLKYICGLSDSAVRQIQAIVGADSSAQRSTMGLLNKVNETPFEAFANVEGFTEEIYNNMPKLTVFGSFDLSVLPSSSLNLEALKTLSGWLVLLIPIITFLAYFLSMKVTRKLTYQPMNDNSQAAMGCSTKVMDIIMPLFSVFLAFTYPAALGLYWIFKCLLGMLKQFVISKAMPLPVFTEEDYKAAEKEVNSRPEKNTRVAKSGRVVRSLHHIDDEDFEDTAEKARIFKEKLAAQEAEEKNKAEEAKSNSLFGALKMKPDRKTEEKANAADSSDNVEKPADEPKEASEKKKKKSKKSKTEAKSAEDSSVDNAPTDKSED